MTSTLDMVAEFHRTFGHPIANEVGDETLEIRQLRIKLLFEELEELAEATDCHETFHKLCGDEVESNLQHLEIGGDLKDGDNVDHVAELDALCDLQVVLDGKFLTSGHWKVKNEAFAEVHRSNMSKGVLVGAFSTKELNDYALMLEKTKGYGRKVKCVFREDAIIFRREDGKILKGPNFEEPNLKQFVKPKDIYYWWSESEGYFKTSTGFVEDEPGLRSVTKEEYDKET